MGIPLYGFTETMRGTWTPHAGGGRKTMWFRAEADATDAWRYFRKGTLILSGKLHAEGLSDEVPTSGTLARSMTTLPGEVLDEDGKAIGDALLYFDLRNDLLPFLATFRRGRSPRQLVAAEAAA